jgi:flagellar motility protein MotE (MotC chaperone)
MTAAYQSWRARAGRSQIVIGGAVLALIAIACEPAGAQDAWAPVVVAAMPPHDRPAAEGTPVRVRPRRGLSETPASPSPPSPSVRWDGLPPLATVAARTVAAADRPREVAEESEGDVRLAREYCLNIADAASDARMVWQKKVLADLEQQIAKRVELLEAKTAEYKQWLARREEFSKKAQDSVVTIYARMRPDAAAAQLVAMDEETAAAVLTKLDPRTASLILNDMEPAQAARLTATISGAANPALPGRPRPPLPGDKRS